MSVMRKLIMQAALLAVGLAMMALGLSRGEALYVLSRGITICMECIGIG